MILKKGYPNRYEFVICTVKSISSHSAFVSLDEYENVDAMLHISEVASGRIKNMKSYLQKDKQVVCLVMKVIPKKGYVDVSLKRVSESDKRKKFAEYRMSRRLDSMLSFMERGNKSFKREEIEKAIISEYPTLGAFLRSLQRKGLEAIDSLQTEERWKSLLKQEIGKILEKKHITMKRSLSLSCYEEDGAERIRGVFRKISSAHPELQLKYGGAPKYFISLTTNDYKQAEKELQGSVSEVEELCRKNKIILGVEK